MEDKSKLDEAAVRRQMTDWVNEPVHKKHPGREWVYDGKKHWIIAEEMIPSDPDTGGLVDYKFFCFDGKAEFLYIVKNHKIGFYDTCFKPLRMYRTDYLPVLEEKYASDYDISSGRLHQNGASNNADRAWKITFG